MDQSIFTFIHFIIYVCNTKYYDTKNKKLRTPHITNHSSQSSPGLLWYASPDSPIGSTCMVVPERYLKCFKSSLRTSSAIRCPSLTDRLESTAMLISACNLCPIHLAFISDTSPTPLT